MRTRFSSIFVRLELLCGQETSQSDLRRCARPAVLAYCTGLWLTGIAALRRSDWLPDGLSVVTIQNDRPYRARTIASPTATWALSSPALARPRAQDVLAFGHEIYDASFDVYAVAAVGPARHRHSMTQVASPGPRAHRLQEAISRGACDIWKSMQAADCPYAFQVRRPVPSVSDDHRFIPSLTTSAKSNARVSDRLF